MLSELDHWWRRHPASRHAGTVVICAALVAGVIVAAMYTGSGARGHSASHDVHKRYALLPASNIPDQVPVAGPNGYVGTVAKSDIVVPPPLTAAGTPPPVSAYPGASIVLASNAGYPVMNNGVLVGYWVPGHLPSTFVTVAQAESENAVPSQGASPVGTATAVTPPSAAANPAP
jgi:hypothetical protein